MPFSIEPTGRSRRPGPSAVRGLGLAALLLVPLALGGCGMLGFGDDSDVPVGPQPCPAIGVLDGANRVTVFNGRGHDLTDIVARAEIRKAVTKCKYDGNEISVDIAFDGQANLGPAATSRDLTLKGFVTVVRHGTIKQKQVFDIPVAFDGASRSVRFLKTIDDTRIPIGGTLDGSAYELLVGFQLTRDELDYNRKVPPTPLE